jgi:hypothetical protein
VTVEDQTSALLCCAEAHALPPWSPDLIIQETLKHYAERGDIQVKTITLARRLENIDCLYICGTRAKCPKSKSPPKKCSF